MQASDLRIRVAAAAALWIFAAVLPACNPPPPRGKPSTGAPTPPPPAPPSSASEEAVCHGDGGAALEGCADPTPRCLEVWRDAEPDDSAEPDCASLLAD